MKALIIKGNKNNIWFESNVSYIINLPSCSRKNHKMRLEIAIYHYNEKDQRIHQI